MKKINFHFFLILCFTFSIMTFGQTIKTVYTIGSNYSPGTCYLITPLAVQPPSTGNNYASVPGNETNNSYIVTGSTPAPIYDIIIKAYGRGFRHFYFQEGLYIINTPINLDGLNGITIEGGGAGTVFKPATASLTTIFDVKNCNNGKIKNIGIDLKTTLVCGTAASGQDANDANTGIKIGTQVGRCLFENIFFRSNIATNATIKATSPILVQLNAAEESDYNTFNNIQYQRSLGGIVLEINGGVFSHNTFSNIHLDLCTVGVAFTGTGGIIEGNLFSNFDVQADDRTAPVTGELRRRTIDIVQNIRGVNNTFQNFQIADFNPCTTVDAPNGCPRLGYVFNITSEAERTTIENTETEGNFVSASTAKNGWYLNNGIGTQFINNASTNRLTDYIKHNLSDVIFAGQNSPNPISNTTGGTNFDATVANSANKNYFRVDNFGAVTFNGRTQNLRKAPGGAQSQDTYLNSSFYAENYGSYTFGNTQGNVGSPNTNLFTASGSLFTIKGRAQFQPHSSGLWNHQANPPGIGDYYIQPLLTPTPLVTGTLNIPTPLCVITNRDYNGTFQWTKVSDILSGSWSHIATKNIKMDGFALTNHSNASPATNTDAGLRLDNNGNVRIGTVAPFATNPAKLQVDGRVSIGTANDATNNYDAAYKLLVNGKVLVRNEVYVKQDGIGWADYVFAKDYKLMPLQEVEKHIKEKGYLPNMPSATEVEKDGIAVGDLIKRQQEKIEELTLYLIEMQKRMEVLENNQKN